MFAIRARRKVATEQDFLQSVEKVVSATETLARNSQHIQSFSYHGTNVFSANDHHRSKGTQGSAPQVSNVNFG
jgi:hypothetical protein